MSQNDKTVAIVFMITFFTIGAFGGFMYGLEHVRDTYKKCRYYDQTIERCVTELGWEKK